MSDFEKTLALYDYALPPDLIADTPATPRDSARLLVFYRSTEKILIDTFQNIDRYLPKHAVLVFNDTKVIPARMKLTKTTGGKVEALYLAPVGVDHIHVLATGTLHPGDILTWEDGNAFTVIERNGKEAILLPSFAVSLLPTLLERYGHIPLPPYIDKSPLTESQRREEYQTVYAREQGSIAAPTAGLHFTADLLARLRSQGISTEYVTLHVHLGTFAPLEEHQWKEKRLHAEHYSMTPEVMDRLNTAKKEGRPIIAVGTTTVRTLESACADASSPPARLMKLTGSTSLFITEHSPLHFVNHIITNFHLPRTSLLMLVAAFTGREKLMELYRKAIQERMRFYSFGDGMFIL